MKTLKSSIILLLVLILLAFSAFKICQTKMLAERTQALSNALYTAAITCYAEEGFYPPSLLWLTDHYPVQVDPQTFIVDYTIYASNIMPEIHVLSR